MKENGMVTCERRMLTITCDVCHGTHMVEYQFLPRSAANYLLVPSFTSLAP